MSATKGYEAVLARVEAERRLVNDGAYEHLHANGANHHQAATALYVRRRDDGRITVTAEALVRNTRPAEGTRTVAAIVMDRETAAALIGELARLLAEHPERSER